MTITEALKKHTGRLMAMQGVVGVGEGESDGKPCIRVFVAVKAGRTPKSIPDTLEGYAVVVEGSGDFRARAAGRTR